MSSTRRENYFTSIYSAPPKPLPRSEDSVLVNYDYLDTSDHSGYTNAWLNAVSYDKVSVDYYDEYADNWVNFMKTAERMTERKIKYTKQQLLDILYEMTSIRLPLAPPTPKTVRQPIDVTKSIYQPVRQPNNPPDNIVPGFTSSSPAFQLCAKCRARIV
ncbi:hypothetical protein MFLAVUS_003712 [Mucor flavus]|uniref:Uncharacterized protein n=1 Tax=Mucor flavus TaxID=439312 RepID=A0ABP9YTY6_9FUNG